MSIYSTFPTGVLPPYSDFRLLALDVILKSTETTVLGV